MTRANTGVGEVARQHRLPMLISVVLHGSLLAYLAWIAVAPRSVERELVRITLLPPGDAGGAAESVSPSAPFGPPAPPAAKVAARPSKPVAPPKPRPLKSKGTSSRDAAVAAVQSPVSDGASSPASAASAESAVAATTGPPHGGGSGSGKGRGTGSGGASAVQAYLLVVRQRIEQAKRYPVRARRAGVEGVAAVSFDLTSAGEPRRIRVQSTDHPWLGDAAIRAIRDASPFPRLPVEIDKERLHLEVPLRFSLREENQWKN